MYHRISREKRNHAAILYHLLLAKRKNIESFLKLAGQEAPSVWEDIEIYYEFAYLKDRWYGMKQDNEAKKAYLLELVPESLRSTLEHMGPLEFNRFFAARPVPSPKRYQSPARWSPGTMPSGLDKPDFAQVSRVKWCFNIKPDLVIVTGEREAICIETKFDSIRSSYQEPNPAYPELEPITELQCHRYMFEHLMGPEPWKVTYILLSKSEVTSADLVSLTWQDVFARMDASGSHPFVSRWLNENHSIQFVDERISDDLRKVS